jgi:hypothetical protein
MATTPQRLHLHSMLNVGLILELAWNRAPPGREVVERDQVLREIHRLLAMPALYHQHAIELQSLKSSNA